MVINLHGTSRYLLIISAFVMLQLGATGAPPPAPLSDVKLGDVCMSLLRTDLQHVKEFDSTSVKNSYRGLATHTLQATHFGYLQMSTEATEIGNCLDGNLAVDVVNLTSKNSRIEGRFCLRTGRHNETLLVNISFRPVRSNDSVREGRIVSFQYCSLRNEEAIFNGRDALWGPSLIARVGG